MYITFIWFTDLHFFWDNLGTATVFENELGFIPSAWLRTGVKYRIGNWCRVLNSEYWYK